MQPEIDFFKVSGAGNDFLLIDNLNGIWNVDWPAFAIATCSRPFGVGADGILVLEASEKADFLMRYFNADGSFGGMCGNGGRCVSRYASEKGVSGALVRFEACGSIYEAIVKRDTVQLRMPDITGFPVRTQFKADQGEVLNGWFIDTGSPHVVIPADNLQQVEVEKIGTSIRNNQQFNSAGVNVNFYEKGRDGGLALRTFERGVEAETLACGTGAVATALVSSGVDGTIPPARIRVQSGEQLVVTFRRTGTGFTDLSLEGTAHFLFAGTVTFDTVTGTLSEQRIHATESGR